MRSGLNSHMPCWYYTYAKKLEIHMRNSEIRFQISHRRRWKVTYGLINKFILMRISGCFDFIWISTLSKNSYVQGDVYGASGRCTRVFSTSYLIIWNILTRTTKVSSTNKLGKICDAMWMVLRIVKKQSFHQSSVFCEKFSYMN